MIAFMPEIYQDELCYSWFARYYCHSGYPAYGYALDDLFGKRTSHFNAEFIGDRFCSDAKDIIASIIPMEKLILNHTMFPIVRFMNHDRMQTAMKSMINQEGKISDLLPLPKCKNARFLRYCPCCAAEQREKYGESFWTRTANIHGLDICADHRCRLKNTDIELSGRQPPRLHIAEQIIEDIEPEFVNDGLELQFAKYLTDAFWARIDLNNNVFISDFLQSKLAGTKYLSVSGKQRNISLFYNDFMEFYKNLPVKGITDLAQIQKIFTGYRSGFYEICQIAFFLVITIEELTAPILPKKTQEELFREKVEKLKLESISAKKIGKMMGIDHHSIQNAVQKKPKAEHDYSGRKGISKTDWGKLDEETLPIIKKVCLKIYNGEDGIPKRVTISAVERILNLPSNRINYLPKCKNEIQKYEETQEMCWARKIVWQYHKLAEERQRISYSRVCRPLNLRRENFISAIPFLNRFCEEEEEEKIKGILQH